MKPKEGRAPRAAAEAWPPTIVPLEKPFVDARGSIQPLVETPMKSAMVIFSKKGAVRANHFHKTDWHYCYVLSGSAEHFQRPAGSSQKPEKFVARAGQMVFTPPMTEHADRFLEDTVLLVLSRNSRDQNAYEEDVVRTSLIEP